MKIDVINMLRQAARTVRHSGDGGRAYVMLEFANHLRLLMRGEVSLEEWNRVYVGADRAPIDIDAELPEPKP
jgi:hypothetical protein